MEEKDSMNKFTFVIEYECSEIIEFPNLTEDDVNAISKFLREHPHHGRNTHMYFENDVERYF